MEPKRPAGSSVWQEKETVMQPTWLSVLQPIIAFDYSILNRYLELIGERGWNLCIS